MRKNKPTIHTLLAYPSLKKAGLASTASFLILLSANALYAQAAGDTAAKETAEIPALPSVSETSELPPLPPIPKGNEEDMLGMEVPPMPENPFANDAKAPAAAKETTPPSPPAESVEILPMPEMPSATPAPGDTQNTAKKEGTGTTPDLPALFGSVPETVDPKTPPQVEAKDIPPIGEESPDTLAVPPAEGEEGKVAEGETREGPPATAETIEPADKEKTPEEVTTTEDPKAEGETKAATAEAKEDEKTTEDATETTTEEGEGKEAASTEEDKEKEDKAEDSAVIDGIEDPKPAKPGSSGKAPKIKSQSRHVYKSQILPPEIYKREYDEKNNHLPTAVYYSDYDAHLFQAVSKGNLGAIRALLDAGRAIDQVNPHGETPLMTAVRDRNINIVRLLLGRHADPNYMDPQGITPLHYAVMGGDTVVIELLLSAGANPNLADYAGTTPLMLAEQRGNLMAVRLMERRIAG